MEGQMAERWMGPKGQNERRVGGRANKDNNKGVEGLKGIKRTPGMGRGDTRKGIIPVRRRQTSVRRR
jgi:hypothetical protein